MLTDDETRLATAARFLFDMGNDEAAGTLLRCDLDLFDDDDSGFPTQPRAIVSAPSTLFLILSDKTQPISMAIRAAIVNVVPRKRLLQPIPVEVGVAISFVVGYPDRSEEKRAELLRHARRSEAPIFDPLPLRKNAPLMLITPLEIFPVDNVKGDKKNCFIIMPFAPAFKDVETTIRRCITDAGLNPVRGDDILLPGDILAQVWRELLQARIVIADLSHANGNVLYELGLAHAIGHNAILLTQDIQHVPFDLRSRRHVIYTPTENGLKELGPTLTSMLTAMGA